MPDYSLFIKQLYTFQQTPNAAYHFPILDKEAPASQQTDLIQTHQNRFPDQKC